MKVYTKTGDKGTTGLYTGERVEKDSIRVDAYGSIDEVNSALGMARAWVRHEDVKSTVLEMQKMLMRVMADVASLGLTKFRVEMADVDQLEKWIDGYSLRLLPLNHFIIPGDTQGAAVLDMARTTTRRAERNLWKLARQEKIPDVLMIVLNRISDLCFVLSRIETEIPIQS